jgi:excisionase family DNA binding protein
MHPMIASDDTLKRLLYPPREAERLLSISHASLYRLLGAGRLAAVKIGSRSYVTRESIDRFLAELPPAQVGNSSVGEAA